MACSKSTLKDERGKAFKSTAKNINDKAKTNKVILFSWQTFHRKTLVVVEVFVEVFVREPKTAKAAGIFSLER